MTELDLSKPIMMTAYPDAECTVLGKIRSFYFPIIVAVSFHGMEHDIVYHVSPDDGKAICGYERGEFNFVNRE